MAKLLTFRLFTVLCSTSSNSSATVKGDKIQASRMYGSKKGYFIVKPKFLAIKCGNCICETKQKTD